jgi:predicted phage-related endonuclease
MESHIVITEGVEQGTADWQQLRCGCPTASRFADVLAKGRGGGESVTRRKYLLSIVAERLTQEVSESYSNAHMDRGKALEAEARDLYSFRTGADVRQVAFIRNTQIGAGASPDGLIGDDGMLEIKTRLPELHLELLLTGGLPSEHKAQVQGQMMIAGRQWVDYVSYWPKLPLYVIRVERDEEYISLLRASVKVFSDEVNALVAQFTEAA